MTTRCTLPKLIALLGALPLLSALLAPITSDTLATELVRDEGLQAIEAVHKNNVRRLHDLHHEMRGSLKQLSQDRSEQVAGQQLAAQVRAFKQVLETVAATEKDHPQWPLSWSQRHARVVILIQNMEGLLIMGPKGQDGSLAVDHLGKKLKEIKEILDIW